jgi:drug/metabolite transporter (DMT)-like permease
MGPAAPPLSVAQGRLCVVLAAVVWSTSGAFTKVLREDTRFGLNQPPVPPLQIAFIRAFCAAAVLLPLLRRRDLSFRPALLATGACGPLWASTHSWASWSRAVRVNRTW